MSRYAAAPTASGRLLITDVTVIDAADASATPARDVLIQKGTIVAVGATGTLPTDTTTDATLIDGRGRWLIPGFIDAHAHALNTPDDIDGAYALMLANGIVGYRQMSGNPALLAARASGTLPSPLGAPALLALPGDLLTPMNAGSAEAAIATVRQQKAQGADFIKAALVGHDGFLAALEEGRRIGIPVVGHLPGDVDPREAARGGMRSIEHLGPGATVFAAASSRESEVRDAAADQKTPPIPKIALPGMSRIIEKLIRGIVVNPSTRTSKADAHTLTLADTTFDEAAALALARIFVENETWQCPTLIRMHTQQFPTAPEHAADPRRRYIAPDELRSWDKSAKKFAALPSSTRDALEAHWSAQLRLTKTFADAGVPMLAGTDADGAGGVIPGFALHDEFDLLATAGLRPRDILRMATSNAARFLGRASAGRIGAGADADLVLLDANPLDDHRALHAVSGVVRGGAHWDRAALDATLAAVAASPGAR